MIMQVREVEILDWQTVCVSVLPCALVEAY
jgi:hypothetical protein